MIEGASTPLGNTLPCYVGGPVALSQYSFLLMLNANWAKPSLSLKTGNWENEIAPHCTTCPKDPENWQLSSVAQETVGRLTAPE